MQRQYWRFYWPLMLTGLILVLQRQCQNGVLGRFPDATAQLALWALAAGVFHMFNAALNFLPQMVTVFARSPHARRMCLVFILVVASGLFAPLAILAFTPAGPAVLGRIFAVEGASLETLTAYLRYLAPLTFVNALQHYWMGLLVKDRKTGLVTGLNILSLAILLGGLLAGLAAGWTAVRTLATAMVASSLARLAASYRLYRRFRRSDEPAEHEDLRYRELASFFWPVAVTSTMFALSRPILYSLANRLEDGAIAVAALRVASDITMIFQGAINQFRHLFVTFGLDDLAGIRRFMGRVLIVVMTLMLLTTATPVSDLLLEKVLGVAPAVGAAVRRMLWVLCLLPVVVAFRNYYHGVAMSGMTTRCMAAGGVSRVAATYLAGWALYSLGWFTPTVAAAVLLGGFTVETIVVIAFSRLRDGRAVRPVTDR